MLRTTKPAFISLSVKHKSSTRLTISQIQTRDTACPKISTYACPQLSLPQLTAFSGLPGDWPLPWQSRSTAFFEAPSAAPGWTLDVNSYMPLPAWLHWLVCKSRRFDDQMIEVLSRCKKICDMLPATWQSPSASPQKVTMHLLGSSGIPHTNERIICHCKHNPTSI